MYTSAFFDYVKASMCITTNCGKFLKEMGITGQLFFLLRNLHTGQEETELDMEQQTGSTMRRECIKVVYCHPAYLTYMQSTSFEILDWMNHKLESRFLGEISTTSYMQILPP